MRSDAEEIADLRKALGKQKQRIAELEAQLATDTCDAVNREMDLREQVAALQDRLSDLLTAADQVLCDYWKLV